MQWKIFRKNLVVWKKWGKLCQPPDKTSEANIKALKFGIAAMINEGIDISNDENGTNDPPVTLKQVGRILSDVGRANS